MLECIYIYIYIYINKFADNKNMTSYTNSQRIADENICRTLSNLNLSACVGSGGYCPSILNIRTSCRRVTVFTDTLLKGKCTPSYPLSRKLRGGFPRSRWGKKKVFWPFFDCVPIVKFLVRHVSN